MGSCLTDLTVPGGQRGKIGVTGAFVAALAPRGREWLGRVGRGGLQYRGWQDMPWKELPAFKARWCAGASRSHAWLVQEVVVVLRKRSAPPAVFDWLLGNSSATAPQFRLFPIVCCVIFMAIQWEHM